MKTYKYIIQMQGYATVTGACQAIGACDAEMQAMKHFMDANDIQKGNETWIELIHFYAPQVKLIRK